MDDDPFADPFAAADAASDAASDDPFAAADAASDDPFAAADAASDAAASDPFAAARPPSTANPPRSTAANQASLSDSGEYSDPFADASDASDSAGGGAASDSGASASASDGGDAPGVATIAPTMGEPAAARLRAAPAARPHPEGEYAFEVEVADPTRVSSGVSAYISYSVRAVTTLPGYTPGGKTVSRRFRDFLWLHECLRKTADGAIVPPLPEKVFIGRFQDHVIEYRRVLLQQFLLRVGTHPILRGARVLRAFLEDIEVPSPKGVKDDVVATLAAFDYRALVPRTGSRDHDGAYDDVLADAAARDAAAQALAAGAKAVVEATSATADAWAAVCNAALELTADYEPTATPVERMMAVIADAASEASDRGEQMAELSDSYVWIPARRAVRALREIKRAVDARNAACSDWWALEDKLTKAEKRAADAASSSAAAAAAAGADTHTTAPHKYTKVETMAGRVAVAAAEFDAADARLKADLDLVAAQRVEDAAEALSRYVSMRVAAHTAAAQAWRVTLDDLRAAAHA